MFDKEGNPLEDWTIQLDAAFLPLIGLNFGVPLSFRICEAWSNAVMSQLFDQLLARQEITHKS